MSATKKKIEVEDKCGCLNPFCDECFPDVVKDATEDKGDVDELNSSLSRTTLDESKDESVPKILNGVINPAYYKPKTIDEETCQARRVRRVGMRIASVF